MKMKPLNLVNVILTTICLTLLLFISATAQTSPYDPWCDSDDDGDIDIFDIVDIAGRYGSSGEPLVGKAGVEFDSGWVNIIDKNGTYFNIPHTLGSTEAIVDIVGKRSLTTPEHKIYYGDPFGVKALNLTYGGTSRELPWSIIQTREWGYALAGYTWSYGAGSYDFWLVKTDVNGNLEWNQTYGAIDDERAYSVIQTIDGGYALAGVTRSFGAGNYDFWLVKTDADGNHKWNQTYGGLYSDETRALIETNDGGYALAGYTQSFGAGNYDFWLVKTDANGNHQWSQTYGGSESELAYSVAQTSDGGYALAGFTGSAGAGFNDFWLVKTDVNGNHEWNQTYGGTDYDVAYSMIQTIDAGFALAGYTYSFGAGNSDFWLVKTDVNGNHEWNHTNGGADIDEAWSVIQTSPDEYVMGGLTFSFSIGSSDFWLVKMDANGNIEWNKRYGGANIDEAHAMVHSLDGGCTVVGETQSYGAGNGDFWLLKTNVGGNIDDSDYHIGSGLSLVGFSDVAVTLYRGYRDVHWNYVRVRIWKIREAP